MSSTDVNPAILAACALGLALTAPASRSADRSADPATIARSAGCAACHAPDKKLYGPAYRDIAHKYHGDASAPGRLAHAVRTGSKGVWGPAPMLPVPVAKVSDADLSVLIAWILAQ